MPKARRATDEEVSTVLAEYKTPSKEQIMEAMTIFYQPLAGAKEDEVAEASASETGERVR